jgi:hypothetical protein
MGVAALVEHVADAKVAKLGRLAVHAEEDVLGLDVAVDDAIRVEVLEPEDQLGKVALRLLGLERRLGPARHVEQRPARTKLEHHEEAVRERDVEHLVQVDELC